MDNLKKPKQNIFIFDYETTGINPYHNDVIEAATKLLGSDSLSNTNCRQLIPKNLEQGIHRLVLKKLLILLVLMTKC